MANLSHGLSLGSPLSSIIALVKVYNDEQPKSRQTFPMNVSTALSSLLLLDIEISFEGIMF